MKITSISLAALVVLAVHPMTASAQQARVARIDSVNAQLRIKSKRKSTMTKASVAASQESAARFAKMIQALPLKPPANAGQSDSTSRPSPPALLRVVKPKKAASPSPTRDVPR